MTYTEDTCLAENKYHPLVSYSALVMTLLVPCLY